jgi:hypothetical protein
VREPLLLRASDVTDIQGADGSRSNKLREANQSVFVLALPTLCDAVSTVLMNIGLYYTSAGVFQMLRGTVVFFAGVDALTHALMYRGTSIHLPV